MIFNNNSLCALLPANKVYYKLYSHQGLTYGGLILKKEVDASTVTQIQQALLNYLQTNKFECLLIKALPEFYRHYDTNKIDTWTELDYRVVKQNIVMAIDFRSDFKIHKTKIKRFNKLKSSDTLHILEGQSEFEVFWNSILVKRLKEKHNSKPVHSLSEIQYLQSRFKNEIFQFNIYQDKTILGGITLFKKGKVVKSQYAMANQMGEKLNAVDMLFVYLIMKFQNEGCFYFSMGSVNDNSKLGYNEGMLKQKEELGCSQFEQEIFEININD